MGDLRRLHHVLGEVNLKSLQGRFRRFKSRDALSVGIPNFRCSSRDMLGRAGEFEGISPDKILRKSSRSSCNCLDFSCGVIEEFLSGSGYGASIFGAVKVNGRVEVVGAVMARQAPRWERSSR